MKKILLYTFLFFWGLSNAQSNPSTGLQIDNTISPVDLVTNYLVAAGLNPFNIKFNTGINITQPRDQVSRFYTNNPTNLGIDKGIVMCTGKTTSVVGPNNMNGSTTPTSLLINTIDTDLASLTTQPLDKPVVLEFDFVATGKELSFDFVFASEEYDFYSTGAYNDVFGFFISGPGINGNNVFTNNAVNIAKIPTTTTGNFFVTMNNVNNGTSNTGPCTNCAYYTHNNLQWTQFNGFTKLLTAKSALECGGTYHIKLAISNVSDNLYDSAVFIKNFAVPPLKLLINGSSQSPLVVCSGSAANLTSGLPIADTRFEWLFNGVVLPLETGPNLSTTIPGVYTINAYSVPGNCKFASATVTVSFTTSFTTALPLDFKICAPVATSYNFGNISQPALLATIANLSDYEIKYYDTSFPDAQGGNINFLTTAQVTAYSSNAISKTIWIRIEDLNATISCPLVLPFTLKVETPPSGTFSYAAATFCNNLTSETPIKVALSANGVYTATPAGLSINANTGIINPSLSTVGNYTVSYFIAATAICPAFTTPILPAVVSVEIKACGCSVAANNTGPKCLGSSINLDVVTPVVGAISYRWTTTSGYDSGLLTNPLVTLTPTTAGSVIYTLEVISSTGNCTSTTQVTVNPLPVITGAITVCNSKTTALSCAASPATGNPWSVTNGTGTATITSVGVLQGTSVGTVTVVYTDTNGCQGNKIITISALPQITTAITGASYSICVGQDLDLDGPSAAPTPWTTSDPSKATINTTTGIVTGNAPGTVTITFTDSYSCDATQVITVIALPVIQYTSNFSVCASSTLSLRCLTTPATGNPWSVVNGTGTATITSGGFLTGNTAGTVDVFYTALSGCKGKQTIIINALPVITTTSNVFAMCVGNTLDLDCTATGSTAVAAWSVAAAATNATISTTGLFSGLVVGNYVVTFTDVNGCTDTKTISVTSGTLAPTVQTNVIPYCFNELNVAPLATLVTGTSLLWYADATSTTVIAPPTVDTSIAGPKSYFVTQTNGCISPRAEVKINVKTLVNPPIVNTPFGACQGITVTSPLTATGTALKWYDSLTSTTVITAPIPNTATEGTTSYYVTQMVSNCESVRAKIDVIITLKPTAPLVSALSYCIGTTDIPPPLTATGQNLKWYTALTAGTQYATAPLPSTATVGPTDYYVSQSINGCESDRSRLTVTIVAAPSLVIVPPVAVCEPITVNIKGSVIAATSEPGVFSYWKDATAINYSISEQEATAIAVSGPYYLKLTNATGCSTIQLVTVTIYPKPVINLDQNGYVCIDKDGMPLTGSDFNLQTGLSGNYSFTWYNDTNGIATLPITGAISSNYKATSPGIYRVKVINNLTNCTETSSVTVVSSIAPDKIELTNTSYFEDDKTIIVNATPASNYEYQLDNGVFQESNTFIGVTSGDHKIVVRDKYGCGQKEGTLRLLDFPKYFTPNGDGFNDTWNIFDIKIEQPNAKIYIFDRLGKLLKQISPESGNWDGTINGTGLPADDYWFTVEYVEDSVAKIFKSHFSLKR